MANRLGSDRVAGRGLPRQPPGLRDGREVEEDEAAGGPIDAGSRSSAWERMLETLGDEDDVGGVEDGLESLHASIAERLHAIAPVAEEARPPLRTARRRRR
jgi:hypothetical protein